jgi:tetratricopeptide (TPR) repeat protein
MLHRALFLAIAFTTFTSFCFAQVMGLPNDRSRDNSFGSRFAGGNASLDGTLVSEFDNKPISNARIELRNPTNGTVVSSAYTNSAGGFQFGSVPQGLYQIVALLGTSQVEDRVDVNSFRSTVNLRMPVNNPPAGGNTGNTISVVQYRIPDKARNEFEKAQQASAKVNLEEARKHVAKALEIFPGYPDALTLRAILNLSTNLPAAVADLEKAIQSDGNYALAYTVLGSAFNMQQKFDEAIRTLEHGQSLAPNSWQSYFEMARSYAGKMDYQTALRALERAQSLVPVEYPPIRLVRAQVLLGLRQYEQAMADLQAFLQKDPNGPNSATAQQMLEKAKQLLAKK